ncbi:MAG: kelch repeat-containing protein, partial [Candidatus Rokubacteria bacterium]|nr:kelch repeat-containing protein [Candidatus Rokubacteria bacterium]
MTYDSINRRVVQMAGSGGSYMNDVWWYDAAGDLWTQIEPNFSNAQIVDFVPPCPRDEMAIEYDPVNQLYWMFGGSGFACVGPIRTAGSGTTTTTLVDSTLTATAADAYKDWSVQGVDAYNTFAYVSAYDPVSKTLTLATPFAGLAPGGRYNLFPQRGGGGTWYYSPVTHTWGSLTGPHWGYSGQSPGSRLSPSMAYSSLDQALVMFGGQGANDTWALDVLTKTWVQQIPGGSPGSPAGRAQITNAMVYDSTNDVFILFGGCLCSGNGGSSAGDTWAYRLSTNTWTNMNPPVSPPARQAHNMVYDSTNGVVVLFGGFDAPSGTYFNDLWVYSYASNTWTQVFPALSPPVRAIAAMAYDPVNQVAVLYGGAIATGSRYDVWSLQLAGSSTPNPVPSITSISPNTIAGGGPSFTLTVTGANFVPDSVVRWNGVARPTTYVRNTQLQASIPAGDIASPGSRTITVFTPSPGGGTSSGLTLTVTGPAPTVASITPNQGPPGTTVPVTITGTGFVAGAAVSLSGTGITVSGVSVSSATQLAATLTIASGAALGARDVTVSKPGGGAGTLAGGFTVVAPVTLALAYNGKLRDRVGQGNTALGPDGAFDGTLTATLSASGGRTVTALRLDSNAPGTWDTTSGGSGFWVLAVAPALDGALLNAPGTMAVNFPVANGGTFVLFASDYLNSEFLPGRTLTLT